MWLLNFLPDWIFYFLIIFSIVGLVAVEFLSNVIPAFAYRLPVQAALAALLVYGVYMSGAISNEEKWKQRVEDVQKKLVEAENKSAIETVKVVEKVVYEKQIIKQKGDDVIKYIDKEVVKYDTKFLPGGPCEMPKEFIESINKAAE